MTTKILYVVTKANFGGAQRYVYDLALAARDAGHEVTVAYGEPGVLSANLAEARIRTISVPELARDVALGKDFKVYRTLRDLFSKNAFDVVHLNSAKAAGLGALAARRAGVPHIIFTAHGWAFNEARPLWQRILIRIFSGLTVFLSHKTICVSEAVRRDIKGFPCIGKKLIVIHNGITCPVQLPRDAAREAILPHHEKDYWIGMVSELHTTKRIDDGIRAFAKIKDAFPNTIFVSVGEGEELGRLLRLVKELGIENRVFFPGFVHDVRAKLSAFDLFLHTSQSEALGYAILEAGCATAPTVATNVGGIPEIIQDGVTGILVPPFRPDVVAEKLSELIRDPAKAHEFGEALHERVRRDFTKEQMALKTFALY
jgi:glycosyltransferase involved in cell wall biosynthesis